jgi:SAM-dependent methyltransferase
MMLGMSDQATRNRRQWNAWADSYAEPGRQAWMHEEITWGILTVPERELGLLGDVHGRDVVELGCGTAYFSSWLARLGANVIGVDLSERQLKTARRCQQEFGIDFPLIQANAEHAPLRDESFDLAFSEYGASIWADPYAWIPEAARLLRPGGELVFLVNGALLMLCTPDEETEIPAGDRLLRPYFGMHRFEWKSDDSVEFHLGHGELIQLLRNSGLDIERLVELQPSPNARSSRFNFFTTEWAQRWPAEEIWKARKHGGRSRSSPSAIAL